MWCSIMKARGDDHFTDEDRYIDGRRKKMGTRKKVKKQGRTKNMKLKTSTWRKHEDEE